MTNWLTVVANVFPNTLIFLLQKNWVAFALQNLLTFFQQKNINVFAIFQGRNSNVTLANNFKFEQVSPDIFFLFLRENICQEPFPWLSTT